MPDHSHPATSADAGADGLIDTTDLHLLAEDLLEGWHAADRDLTFSRSGANAAIAITALGLSCHQIAQTALRLLRENLVLEATPLIRLCFEGALKAQWLQLVPDAVISFVGEQVRQRRNQAKTLRSSALLSLHEIADNIDAKLPPESEVNLFTTASSKSSARKFNELCDDLEPGGSSAYAHFAVLSEYSHASAGLVDLYLEAPANDSVDGLPTFVDDPQIRSSNAWSYLLAASLVWAGRAVDMADKNHPRRSELRSAAQFLGIKAELKMSEKAVKRVNESRRKSRHASGTSSR